MNPLVVGLGALFGGGALLVLTSRSASAAAPTSYVEPRPGQWRLPWSRIPSQGTACPPLPPLPATFTGDLSYLHPAFRSKIETLITRLEQRGFRPRVHTSWRSDDYQDTLVAQGKSWTDFSFHNVVDHCGTPKSLAVDIIDRRWAWDDKAAERGFWTAVQEEAERLGLHSGNRWTGRSWDPAHVQAYSRGSGMLAQLEGGDVPQALSYAGHPG